MRTCWMALTLVVGLAAGGSAEPLDCAQVPADAQWLVHVDLSAISRGVVSQKLVDRWLQLPATRQGMQRFRWATGVDLSKDLEGITIYGRSYEQDRAVTIFRAKVDQERLMRYLRGRPGFRTSEYGRHGLMSWTERNAKSAEQSMAGCFYQPTIWLFAAKVDDLKLAIDVLDGKSPALAADHPLRPPKSPEGALIEARGVELGNAKLPFESPLIRKSSCLFALGGENDAGVYVDVQLTTESTEVAGQLRSVAEGLLAMARLRFDKDPERLRLLEAVKVSQEETTVNVQCRWSTDELLSVVKKSWTSQPNAK